MSCFATMDYTIMPCLGLKPAANLEKTFMLDKMEPDRIFLLMVRLKESVFIYLFYHYNTGGSQGWQYLAHKTLGINSDICHLPSTWDDIDTAPGHGKLTNLFW